MKINNVLSRSDPIRAPPTRAPDPGSEKQHDVLQREIISMELSRTLRRTLLVLTALIIGCSDGGGGSPDTLSTGLKMFVTSRVHNGNFRDDVVLVGATPFEKADDFCQSDPARPSAATYKALLVDGVLRDAVTQTDWVLKPTTAYFQPLNDVRIGVTTAAAVFPTASNNLDHNIHNSFGTSDDPNNPAPTSSVWTGLAEASTFAASTDTCQGWSSSLNGYYSTLGISYATDGSAFSSAGLSVCSLTYRLYCVEQ
jgi:hypothetical protein